MRKAKASLLIAALLALAGCGKPVPPEKSSFVGEWQSQTMALLITSDGSVKYKRLQGGMTKSIEGPLQGFQGDNFEVGIGPVSTNFVVSAAPHEDGGKWKMTVDGVELIRVR